MIATDLFSVSRAIRLAIGNEGNFDRNEVAEKVVSQIPEHETFDEPCIKNPYREADE